MELIEIPRKAFTERYWSMPWETLRQCALRGQDDLRVFIPAGAVYRDQGKLRESWTGGEGKEKFTQYRWLDPDVALMREGDSGCLRGRAILFGQNW